MAAVGVLGGLLEVSLWLVSSHEGSYGNLLTPATTDNGPRVENSNAKRALLAPLDDGNVYLEVPLSAAQHDSML